MKVGIDARCLNTRHVRGMGKVLQRLLDEGLAAGDWTFELFGDEPRLPLHAPASARVSSTLSELKGHRFHAWEQIALPWLARRKGCDVLLCPATTAPYWQPVPAVVVVHDTLPWLEHGPTPYLANVLPAAYRKAAAIVTPSENSRRDIEHRWPDLAGRIEVIRWAISSAYQEPGIAPLAAPLATKGVRPPYLLYFGGEIPRKRLSWAIDVWRLFAGARDIRLVLCGLQAPERFSGDSRIIPLGFVAEADMPALYAHADAVLYPTEYEGFGFPALESQAVGTPILMSASGSLAELAGPGAILLPHDELRPWVEALDRADAHRAATRDAARAWARRFTWPSVWQAVAGLCAAAAVRSRR